MQTQPAATPDRRALSNLKHGLTGKIYLLSQADQVAYDNLCRGIHESMAPVGPMETELVQSMADDRWRLSRIAALESAIFAEGVLKFASDSSQSTGDPETDAALSNGRTWSAEARNLNLLTLYESRIQRHFEKTMAALRNLQADRKAAVEQAIDGPRSSRNSRNRKAKPTIPPRPSSSAILNFQPAKSLAWWAAGAA